MKRLNGLITAVLILLSLAGIAWAAIFLQSEKRLSEARQMEVSRLTDELVPLNEKRKELQARDKEWQETLEAEKEGKPCIMLVFDTMEKVLYETMYDMMDQYGFRGTFVLQDNGLPGDGESLITSGQFDEIMSARWEYAVKVPDDQEKEAETEEPFAIGFAETEDTEESETQETETEDHRTYLQKLDDCLDALEERGMEKPVTLVCSQKQYEAFSDAAVADRGFRMACVFTREDFPTIGEKGEHLWKIDGGVFKQRDLKLEEFIGNAVAKGNSMVISVSDVVRISNNPLYDLSVTKFGSLLIYLKNLEEQGLVNILTLSEFYQYGEQQEQAYSDLVSQYRNFRVDMDEQMEELDKKEQAVVDSVRVTEAQQ